MSITDMIADLAADTENRPREPRVELPVVVFTPGIYYRGVIGTRRHVFLCVRRTAQRVVFRSASVPVIEFRMKPGLNSGADNLSFEICGGAPQGFFNYVSIRASQPCDDID